MKSVKLILVGMALILIGIFLRVMGIGYGYGRFWIHYLPIGLVIASILLIAVGAAWDDE